MKQCPAFFFLEGKRYYKYVLDGNILNKVKELYTVKFIIFNKVKELYTVKFIIFNLNHEMNQKEGMCHTCCY